jgi:hypothetical protein
MISFNLYDLKGLVRRRYVSEEGEEDDEIKYPSEYNKYPDWNMQDRNFIEAGAIRCYSTNLDVTGIDVMTQRFLVPMGWLFDVCDFNERQGSESQSRILSITFISMFWKKMETLVRQPFSFMAPAIIAPVYRTIF